MNKFEKVPPIRVTRLRWYPSHLLKNGREFEICLPSHNGQRPQVWMVPEAFREPESPKRFFVENVFVVRDVKTKILFI